MPPNPRLHLIAIGMTLTLHAAVLTMAWLGVWDLPHGVPPARPQTVVLQLLDPEPALEPATLIPVPTPAPEGLPRAAEDPSPEDLSPEDLLPAPLQVPPAVAIEAPRAPASMPAPPAPTAEEWAFAARYTLKNSKAYRHSWGQQVRSMMGTAVEGPDQGMVRFRVEIAPDGTLARLQTLWSTSDRAEQLARQAVEAMPPSPPTPTGQPLVFERTIAFTPFAVDGPPSYQNDCKPDPPAFRNPFAWDGRSPAVRQVPEARQTLDPQALEDCLRQLPQDSVEAQMARDQRLMERWRWK